MTKLDRTPDKMNEALKDTVLNTYEGREVKGKHKTLVYSNVHATPTDNGYSSTKKAVDTKATLSQKFKADLTLKSSLDGRVLEHKKGVFIGDIPIYSKKGGFVVDGNTYNIPTQIRLKPSAYTSEKANGDVETMMNLKNGKGMKLISPQDKNKIELKIGTKQFNPLDVAYAMGANEKEAKKVLGDKVFGLLQSTSSPHESTLKLATALGISEPNNNTPISEVKAQIKDYFQKTQIDPQATKETLGMPFSSMNHLAMLRSIKKNIGVKTGYEKQDDKENLMFKNIISPEKLIGEGVNKRLAQSEAKMKSGLNNAFAKNTIGEIVTEPTLKKAAKSFLTTSAISRMPEEYNPLQMLQGSNDVTPLGEGGISDTRMINQNVRSLHMSQLGFIDPIKSPEGANTGVTLSLTHGAHVDSHGNAAIEVINNKTGKKEIKTVGDLWNKKIAFPDVKKDGSVGMRHKDKIIVGNIRNADYTLAHSEKTFGPAMNSLGVISSNDPTRNLMASKHSTQALPLVNGDYTSVSLEGENGKSMSENLAKRHLPLADINGKITNVDSKNGFIHISNENGEHSKIEYAKDKIQLNTKTYLQHTPVVKVGDTVKKGQHLADSNFTKDGKLALGKNLRTSWMVYPGTRNDAFILSESGAKKLTSVHSKKFDISTKEGTIYDKKKFAALFPEVAQKIDIHKYDDKGLLKKGMTVSKDEPISLGFRKMDSEEVKFANDKVKKLMYGGMAPVIQRWKGDDVGTIKEIVTKGANTRVVSEYTSPMKVGDKLAGRSGNKGIVSAILPEKDMPRDEEGNHIELLMGGAGVTSRQNPAQIIEASLTETALKTGKNYVLPHNPDVDMDVFAKQEAKKNNVKLYHKMYDPLRKKHLGKDVFVANYNVMKLFKQGDATYSAIGHGGVGADNQPKKGGKESPSTISNMEISALLAHDAKDFLKESYSIRSQHNKDWFRAFEAGESLPAPELKTGKENFHKMLSQLRVKTVSDKNHMHLLPMTDRDVTKVSTGAVTEPYGLKRNTMTPVKGGFYDTKLFGGTGTGVAHIDLGTKVVNPLYKGTVASLLGTSEKNLDARISNEGVNGIYSEVGNIKPKNKIKELKSEISRTKDNGKINRLFSTIKAIRKTDENTKDIRDAMFMSKVPVLSTALRPVQKLPSGSIVEHDINMHYANIIRSSNILKEAKKEKAPIHIQNHLQDELQKHVGAMYGTNESPDPKMKDKDVKSVMNILAGDNPKTSYWHQKVMRQQVFGSGRAVILPKIKSLGMDEIEIPKYVAWKMFEPHVTRKMSQMGIDSNTSKDMIEKKSDTANAVLHQVMKEVPVVINRAPSLHKHNMTGHYAKISAGNAMHISPIIENAQNADYDGDQMGIHIPFTHAAIKDVKDKLMASKQIMTNSNKNKVIMGIDLDPFIGFYEGSRKK